jgi:hypothetical protein
LLRVHLALLLGLHHGLHLLLLLLGHSVTTKVHVHAHASTDHDTLRTRVALCTLRPSLLLLLKHLLLLLLPRLLLLRLLVLLGTAHPDVSPRVCLHPLQPDSIHRHVQLTLSGVCVN